MEKLIIIDGNSLLFRAYWASAYPGTTIMRTKEGIPTNAVFVFSSMISKILNNCDIEDHLLVAFDTGAKTFRHEQMDTYKAHRKPVPQDLITQMPIAREFLRSLNIFTFEKDGYEGDDVAGTAAILGVEKNYDVHIYTSDKDFLQLVNGKVKINLIKKGMSDIRVMTEQTVLEEFGVTPVQVIEYKGLVGDASDNLPGIPGIGEKTAIKLLTAYGTFENVLAHAKEIGGKVGESLLINAELGRLSKSLATIDTKIVLPFKIDETRYDGYDLDEVVKFANKYELKTYLDRLPKKFIRQNKLQVSFKYYSVSKLPDVSYVKEVGLSLDIDNGNYHQNKPHGIAVAINGSSYYMTTQDFIIDERLKSLLADPLVKKYVFDFKKTKVALHYLGLPLEGLFFDSLLAGYVLDTSSNNDPITFFSSFGAVFDLQQEETTLFSIGNPLLHTQLAFYSKSLYKKIMEEITSKNGNDIFLNIEQPLATVLADMEVEGVPLNGAVLSSLGADFQKELNRLTAEIYQLAGIEFNIASPKQVGEVLFDRLMLPGNKKVSTNAEVLKSLLGLHPIIEKLIDHRKYSKLISTYIESLVQFIFPDGKLHAIFNQAVTTTGRLSSTDPNLQNISIKDEEGRTIRKAFFYQDQKLNLLSFDYSQIELRILASLSQCPALLDVFNNDEDIHTATAKKLFAKDGVVTSSMRRKAKVVNFGIIYGISDWGLSEQLSISPSESKEIINSFYLAFPEIRSYMFNLVSDVTKNGFVSTLNGRRRYLREIHDTNYQTREFAKRAAMNAPIQGTAADLIKLAMIKIHRIFKEKGFESRIILQIHDELIFKVPDNELKEVTQIVKDTMEHALDIGVKLKVEGGHAKNWHDLKG